MNTIYKTLLLAAVASLLFFNAYSQTNTSNKGTNFWLGYMQNIRGVVIVNNEPCELDLYLTSDVSTTGSVNFVDGTASIPFTITANQVTVLVVPQSEFLSAGGQFLKGINVTSVQPIVVFAHIHANAVSGATLALPVNALGKDYTCISYTQVSNEQPAYSAFVVVATEDSTVVQVTPTAGLTTGQPANQTFTLNLRKGELFQGLSTTDLTGTRIQSVSSGANTCKKIAVFSGSSKIMIGCFSTDLNDNTADNLFQQVYPTASWGKDYYTAPLKKRDYDTYRIVLSVPGTNVLLNGVVINPASFTNGYYEFNSTVPNIIQADQPIQVVQYAVTLGKNLAPGCTFDPTDLVGDPEMIFLTPIEQTLKQATLYSTPKEAITSQYINTIIKTADAPSFTIDGVNVSSGFTPFSGDATYSYGQFSVTSGTHNISASGGFNAISYGFGYAESYGYAAGANLQNLDEFVQYTNPLTKQVVTSGCTAQNFTANVTLPYQTTSISWDLQNGSPVYTDSSPVPVSTTQQGTQTLYVYQYPNPVAYSAAGTYAVKVTAFNPISDACGSNDEIDLSFTVADPPVAGFASRDTICLADTIQFHDQTNGKGNSLAAWHYDFGDGDTSNVQNPVHTFLKPGDFTVTLTVTGQTGCISAPYQKKIHVLVPPVAAFTVSQPDCVTRTVTFTDQSTSAERPITQWVYDFGDGTTQTQTTNQAFTHTFSTAGTFGVKLYNITDKGCAGNTVTDSVTIHPLPVVKPVLPDICLSDGTANFQDQSTIADSSMAGFTYLWNFGDAASTANNPNTSAAKNPSHYYLNSGPYNMSLTVTSKDGCSVTKDTTFIVNGTNPQAIVTPVNPTQLCSDHEVFFVNSSTVSPGSITKIEVYYDASDPTSLVVYDHPTIGQIFRHTYPAFYSGTKNYTVHVIAYSGTLCSNPLDIPITLLPVPLLSFPALASVCANAPIVQLSVTETQGPPGSGVFSGDGVSGTTFDPAVAGVGTHTLTYIFTPTNLCADTVTQTITVNSLPVINIGPDTAMLAGASIRLVAKAAGDSLSYKWTPSTGLSADDVLNPVANPSITTHYTLTATGKGGCIDTAGLTVKVLQPPIVPNTFTPNNDGINDTWNIQYLNDYSNCTVEIYNRNGQLLFSSIGYGQPWDGRFKGEPLPIGTYYYIINPKHGRSVISGYITILR